MKNLIKSILSVLTVVSILLLATATAQAQSTTITYGGELLDAGLKADGPYDVRMGVYDAATGGNLIGDLKTNTLDIVDGRFTARMDFGESVFTGGDRWLEVGVRPAGVGNFNTLSPRQQVTSIPHAIKARSATSVTGQIEAGQLTGTISPYNIGAGTIDETKMANGSVRTDKLADGAVTADKIEQISRWSRVEIPANPGDGGFGRSLAAVGTDAYLVGSPQTSNGLGAAYMYDRRGFLINTFLPPPGMSNYGGIVAAMNPDRVIIAGCGTNSIEACVLTTNGVLLNYFYLASKSQGFDQASLSAMGTNGVLTGRPGSATLDHLDGSPRIYFDLPGSTNQTTEFGRTTTVVDESHVLVSDSSSRYGESSPPLGRVYLYDTTNRLGWRDNGFFLFNESPLLTITNPSPHWRFGRTMASSGEGLFLVANGQTGDRVVFLFNATGTLLATHSWANDFNADPFAAMAWVGGGEYLVGKAGVTPNRVDHYNTNGVLLNSYTNPIPGGTGFGDTLAVLGTNHFAVSGNGQVYFYELKKFAPGLIAEGVKDGSVDATALADGAVTSNKLENESVTTTKVADEAVTTTKLADEAVTSDKISDGSVATNDLDASVLNDTFWRLDGNTNTTAGTHFLGTTDNQPLEFRVNNQRGLQLSYATNGGYEYVNVVGGLNFLESGAFGAVIVGGVNNKIGANSPYSMISGGSQNEIGTNAGSATIAGGLGNAIGPASGTTFIGGGSQNGIGSSPQSVIVGGSFNDITLSPRSGIGGGQNNSIYGAEYATISGGYFNRIRTNSSSAAIGGGHNNTISADSENSAIAGGFSNDIGTNSPSSVIGGGLNNTIAADSETTAIAGGDSNEIGTNSPSSVIGGGSGNRIAANSSSSSIGGGNNNTILANSAFATIPGGHDNIATNSSFAAGSQARAIHRGTFVWADPQSGAFFSTSNNQFLVRASGGVGIGTNNPQAQLHVRGTVMADAFVGDGSGLSNVASTATVTNVIADSLLPATIARLNANQTFTASNSFSGVVIATNGANQFNGQFTGIVSGNGAGLTNLNIGSTAVPWANLTNVPGGFSDGLDNDTTYSAGSGLVLGGTQFSVNFAGSGVANNVSRSDHTHDAANITSGSLNDARLSSNVSLRNGTNIFTGTNVFAGVVIATNGGNQFTGQFTGNGAGLTNLNVGSLAGVAYVASNQTFTASNIFAGVVTATNVANQLRGSFTGTLAGNGVGVTNLDASNLTAGIVPDAQLATNVSRLGSSIDSSEITDGTIVNADINAAAGIVDTKLATIATAGKVANTATTATSSNTPNTIVARDASGNFAAGTITASFTGNGSSVTNLNAFNLTAGIVPDARLSNNIPRLNLPNTFTASQIITNGGQVPLWIFGNDVGGTWINLANSSINGRTWNFISSGISNTEGAGKLLFRDTAQGVVMTLSTNGNVGIGTVSPTVKLDVIGTVKATDFIGGINISNLAGGNVVNAMSFTNVGNTFVGNGTGLTNVNAETLDGLDSTAFWKLGGNNITSPTTQFLGSTNNQAVELRVNNQRALRIEPNVNSPNVVGGFAGNRVDGGAFGATVGGGGQQFNTNIVSANFGTVGGGRRNTATASYATIGGGTENQATNSYTTIAGGWANSANGYLTTIAGGGHNTALGNWSTAGGGSWNQATNDGATIAGGEGNIALGAQASIGGGFQNSAGVNATVGGGSDNDATGASAVIGGGNRNIAGGDYGFVGGGSNNIASGGFSVAVGGRFNSATNAYATVLGGYGNKAFGWGSTVGGGLVNTASNESATVPGGYGNVAAGYGSFAAGIGARALHHGDFVWADSIGEVFESTATNQFLVRASGGVGINTTVPGGVLGVDTGVGKVSIVNDANVVPGLVMTGGSNPGILRLRNSLEIWPNTAATSAGRLDLRNTNGIATITLEGVNGTVSALVFNPPSDRNLKENFHPVDPQAVLEKVAALPLSEWSFRTDAERTRHLGPMAQDFHAAFGLGTDNRHIATVDADGVALAAIQGLNQKLEARSEKLEAENMELKARLEKLERLVEHKLSGGAK